ncbi:unnamed protein product [Ectocarpus sp. 8 AP-2014]
MSPSMGNQKREYDEVVDTAAGLCGAPGAWASTRQGARPHQGRGLLHCSPRRGRRGLAGRSREVRSADHLPWRACPCCDLPTAVVSEPGNQRQRHQ